MISHFKNLRFNFFLFFLTFFLFYSPCQRTPVAHAPHFEKHWFIFLQKDATLQVNIKLVCFSLQLDPENTGFIPVENFTSLVEHHELQLDPSKLDMLLALVQSNEEGQVCYQELIELVSQTQRFDFREGYSIDWVGKLPDRLGGRPAKEDQSQPVKRR